MSKYAVVTGVVGEIYSSPDGDELAPSWPESGDSGWEQISPSERAQVFRRRISHSACVWERYKDQTSS